MPDLASIHQLISTRWTYRNNTKDQLRIQLGFSLDHRSNPLETHWDAIKDSDVFRQFFEDSIILYCAS